MEKSFGCSKFNSVCIASMPFSLVRGVSPYRAHSSCPKITLYIRILGNQIMFVAVSLGFCSGMSPNRQECGKQLATTLLVDLKRHPPTGRQMHSHRWLVDDTATSNWQAVQRVLPLPIGGMLDKELSNRGAR
jgi:hypothetical protein